MGFSIMNNTPFHFSAATFTLIFFLAALLTSDETWKGRFKTLLDISFGLMIITGIYVWTLVDFSIPLLVKSLGGLVLIWLLRQLLKDSSNRLYWGLVLVIAAAGLYLAFFFI